LKPSKNTKEMKTVKKLK